MQAASWFALYFLVPLSHNAQDLFDQLGPHVVAQGIQLWKAGSVLVLSRSPDGTLYGVVRDGRERPYRVTARFIPDGAGGSSITGVCACRRSGCAHIAALLWDALDPSQRRESRDLGSARRSPASRTGTRSSVSGDGSSNPALRPGSTTRGAASIEDKHRTSTSNVRAALGHPGSRGTGASSTPWTPEDDALNPAGGHLDSLGDDTFRREVDEWLLGLASLSEGGSSPSPEPERGLDGREIPPAPRAVILYLLDVKLEPMGNERMRPLLGVKPIVLPLLKRGGYGRPRSLQWDFMTRRTVPGYVEPIDDRLLPLIAASSKSAYYDYSFVSHARLHPSRAVPVLERLLETARCHWRSPEGPRLVRGQERAARLVWKLDDQGDQWPDLEAEDGTPFEVLPVEPPWYLSLPDGLCGPIRTHAPPDVTAAFLNGPKLPPESASHVSRRMKDPAGALHLPSPRPVIVENVAGSRIPVPRLVLMGRAPSDPLSGEPMAITSPGRESRPARIPVARLFYLYGSASVDATTTGEFVKTLTGTTLTRTRRNPLAEKRIVEKLEALDLIMLDALHTPLNPGEEPGDFVSLADEPFEHMVRLLQVEVPKLRTRGWVVDVDPSFPCRVVETDLDWYAELSEEPGHEWFGLELGVEVDGARVNLLPVLLAYLRSGSSLLRDLTKSETGLIPMPDGRLLPIPSERVRAMLVTLSALYDDGDLDRGRLPVTAMNAPALAALEESMSVVRARWYGGESLRRLGQRLRDFKGIAPVPPPQGLLAELRPYQKEGLSWLQFLREHDLAGILADDMGLGKTVQALAHLLVEKESGRLDKPSLVVAPTSLMVNWKREAERFAPGLRVVTLHGADRKGRFEDADRADLVLTTYPLLWRDQEALLAREYHLLVLDEAQFIKNHLSKAARIAQQVRARHRVCLTGTPLENRLMELWSLFNVLMPGLLGDATRFRRVFVAPIEKRGDGSRREQLAARVRPFLLRRTKERVATELPRKTEVLHAVELEGDQRDLYEVIRLAMHEKVRREIDKKGFQRSRIVILDALLKLRQVCCDPRLLKLPQARHTRGSAKFEALLVLLEEMVAEGRRVLLFSQFTSMLALIEAALAERTIPYVKLIGETRDRATPVDAFQSGKVPLFLISLRAGGTGLNLTAADTVVLYDPWWNPAVEDQAIDRAHRIGQNKPVFIYKMIVAGSVEEKILALQSRKRELARGVLGGAEDEAAPLTAEDLDALFQPLP